MAEKLFVDQIVLLILSLTFNYFGLSLSIAPGQYKAFGTRLKRWEEWRRINLNTGQVRTSTQVFD
jgi:hypothetical protein